MWPTVRIIGFRNNAYPCFMHAILIKDINVERTFLKPHFMRYILQKKLHSTSVIWSCFLTIILARSQRKRNVTYNAFSHWLRLCSAQDRDRAWCWHQSSSLMQYFLYQHDIPIRGLIHPNDSFFWSFCIHMICMAVTWCPTIREGDISGILIKNSLGFPIYIMLVLVSMSNQTPS